ncbi:uncharacterized protein BJ212DRAFT_1477911 [Suillus subaureus]|uniref:Extracellular mutant protein 11 C-terminal domain-containing protein n=1 Tax=Suillus subaureus TaxID=48587 RepID=A0A9P7JGC1_9AGAM|nr:uncharacterized protein BJ212DRAFT_1477911 [Suillus subaureus]KAG1820813.1 hypothetical protein BJ212DRAFT_1477911 [Suillus subaureus]
MSARQSFVPRSASRASAHADTEHPFDMPLRNQNSLGQPQRTGSIQNAPESMQPKTDSEKKARFAGIFGKHKLAGKPGSGDHQVAIDASLSSVSGRFSGIYRPDIQSLAPQHRSSSPLRGKGSPFVPSSNPGISFARPTSPIANSASHRGDLTISGLKDAHISTAGVVSGLISTSRVIAAPIPSYGSIHGGEHDDEHTFSSNKSSLAKLQPGQLLERIHEDVEPETANGDEALLDTRRTNVAAHPMLRRVKRTIQGTQEDEGDFSPPDEIEYMGRVKRVRIDEFPHELSDGRADASSHSGVDHTRLQPDLDDDTVRQSSPPTGQPGAGAAEEISLDGLFANMDTFLNVETFMGLVQKWSTCSREEWLQGSEEIVNQFKDIIDSVKENLTANVSLYSRLDDQVRDRREEQAQLTEHLRRGLGSARTDLIAICRGK